jgi:hypothetical protein
MTVLRLEHGITDYAVWKAAFDRDPIHREQLGVRSHRVYRPVGDPNGITVDLEFETVREAEQCQAALANLWRWGDAAPALRGAPRVQLIEQVESKTY